MLPRVKIIFENGALGGVSPSEDGVVGLVAHAAAVGTTFALGTPYLITKLDGLIALGITSESTGVNAGVYKTVKEFYSEAPEGSKLWLMGLPAELPIDTLTDPQAGYIQPLLEAARGAVSILMLKAAPVVPAQSSAPADSDTQDDAGSDDPEETGDSDTQDDTDSTAPEEAGGSDTQDDTGSDDPEETGDSDTQDDAGSTAPEPDEDTARLEMEGSIAADTLVAVRNLQRLADSWTETHYAPFLCLVEALCYNGTASGLPDLTEGANNRVAVVLGDSVAGSTGAAVGLVAGRLSAIPVQRSLARVRSGAVATDTMYIGSLRAELADPGIAHDRGYIVPRTFVGKSGYYWSDDKLATAPTDDYAFIARRRIIDKAYRIAYKTLVDEIAEEVPVDAEGKLAAYHCKGVETAVESAIVNSMTSEGNLGNDPDDASDLGVQCYIDPEQNILATSRLEVSLKVKPYGYSKYIDVKLGFKTA